MTGTAFWLFGKPIQWYGIVIALAICIGIILAYRQAKKQGMDPEIVIDLCFWVIPLALVGARLYYVAFEWQQFAADPIRILYIWEGGIAIYGAIIGGLIGLFIYSRIRKKGKLNPLKLIDLLVPSLVLGQAIGRWGNFFNQEAFGNLVTNPDLQFFPFSVFIERTQTWHLATFFYESIWCLGIFVFLMFYRKKKRPDGNILLWYLFLYGIERGFVEGLRTDSLWLIPGVVRVSQALSIVLAIVAGVLLLARYLYRRKNPLRADATIGVPWDALRAQAADAQAQEAESAEQAPQDEALVDTQPAQEAESAEQAPQDEALADAQPAREQGAQEAPSEEQPNGQE